MLFRKTYNGPAYYIASDVFYNIELKYIFFKIYSKLSGIAEETLFKFTFKLFTVINRNGAALDVLPCIRSVTKIYFI